MVCEYQVKFSYDPQTSKIIARIPELNLADFGDTFEKAEANILKALREYLAYLRETGRPIPTPEHPSGTVIKITI